MTTGTQTYKGLAVPLFGESTIKQVTLGTDVLNVESLAAATGSNLFRASLSSSATLSSGYLQGFYAAVATTGVLSSSCQVNAFAADITLSGTPGVEVSGMYLYFAETGTTVMDNCNLNGVVVYFDEMGDTMSYRAGFKVYSDDDSIATNLDVGFETVSANSGLFGAMLGHKGALYPEYILWCQNAPTLTANMCVAYSPTDAATHALRVSLAGTIYNIPMVPDSCS